jgi:uncharacterized phage protein (TIGR02218 family)
MKQASAALQALLASGRTFIMADLYTFTLVGGTLAPLRYSAAPTALSVGGRNFLLGPKFERGKTSQKIGAQVDQIQINVYADTTDLIGETPLLTALWQGQFDGALFMLERVFMPSYGDTSPGTVVLFAGEVADVDVSRSGALVTCRSLLETLNNQIPTRLWQAPCTHVFGGVMCGYNRQAGENALGTPTGAGAQTITAAAGSTGWEIVAAGGLAPNPASLYNGGSIIGVSGRNQNWTRTVGAVSGGTVALVLPFFSAPAIGDTFQILPGCDHTLPTCTNTFQNQARYGGCPFVPIPETAV